MVIAAACSGAGDSGESRGDVDGEVGEAEQAVVAATCFTITRGSSWPVVDAYTHSGNPNTNYGASSSLVVGPSSLSVLRFDLSGMPAGAQLQRANFQVRFDQGNGAAVRVHKATKAWAEATITANSFGASYAAQIEGSFPSTPGFHNTDVTPLVQAWLSGAPNNGLVLESSAFAAMWSSEAAGSRPSLKLCYFADADGDGFSTATDCDDHSAAVHPGALEVCDGVDNNCDGQVDENNPGGGAACNTGLPGVCAAGTTTCQNGQLVCKQNVQPSAETCNGLDDNCNGSVDEFNPGGGAGCSTGLSGACGPGVTTCQGGQLVCHGNVQPVAEVCDGIDNDCNGLVDDGNPGGGATCSTGQQGVCAAGMIACTNGALACVPVQPAIAEACNGLDDNCNGLADEGNPGGGAQCSTGLSGVCASGHTACQSGSILCNQDLQPAAEVCDGLDNNCDGRIDEGHPGAGLACNTHLLGVCNAGVTSCTSGAIHCDQSVAASAEVCDGLDNDCDGLVDEGNPGGGLPCSTGQPGACSAGTTVCQNGQIKCTANNSPQGETCNGLDDNCNGQSDEGNPGGGAVCATGLLGACAAGTTACSSGSVHCNQNVQAAAEVCNGVDDNCNGVVDEGNPGGGVACNTGIPGVCSAGISACTGGSLHCNQTNQASAEVCNGLDDNCNGVVDEGNPGGGAACSTGLQGVCAAGTVTCTSGSLVCHQNTNAGTEICDGLDNNCNGQIDDGAAASCAAVVHGAPACVSGACVIGSCTAPYLDCDGLKADGCETNSSNDLLNCGTCGNACPAVLNAASTCVSGSCGYVCAGNFANCDGSLGNGCESDLQSDPLNCGSCGHSCGGAGCVAGSCNCVPQSCGGLCGTQPDGCGGQIDCGQCVAAMVVTGGNFSCALRTNGTVKCWGINTNGQLGDGTTFDRYEATAVSGLTGVTKIAAGESHVCALVNNGTVKCWGLNSNGQLGDNSTTVRLTPVTVSGLSNAGGIEAGRAHTCAMLNDGTAKCWGYNGFGQIGDNSQVQRLTPVVVSGLAGVTSITAGGNHSCATLTGGAARCWGYNANGQLGDGTTAQKLVPTAVSGVATAVAISTSYSNNSTCALLSNGTVNCWGLNGNGQLGDGTTAQKNTAVAVSGLTQAVEISVGDLHACARTSTGTVQCWGYNGNGALGDGTATQRTTPVQVTGMGSATSIAAGYRGSCAILSDGTGRCWGYDTNGQLGDQTTIQSLAPVVVQWFPCGGGGTSSTCGQCVPTSCSAQGVTSGSIADGCGGTLFCGPTTLPRASAGQYFSCALAADGTARCWGLNTTGQLGDGTTLNRYQPVTVVGVSNAISISSGEAYSCALIQGGSVRCWGLNSNGQLGDGSLTARLTPVVVSGINNAVAISAGRAQACARLADGTAKCWGYNGFGQLGDGTTVQRLTPVSVIELAPIAGISSGYGQTCALLTNGLVRCWGNNTSGQLGNGNTASNIPRQVPGISSVAEAVAASDGDYGCALLSNGTARCWGSNTSYGMLGDGTATDRNLPVAVSGLSNAVHLSANNLHTCAQLADGTGRCWGYNGTGATGDGTLTSPRLTPVTIANVSNINTIAPGYRHTCALLNDGSAKCWGDNTYGEIGDLTTINNPAAQNVYAFPCGGGGTSNVCGACVPTTCAAQGAQAGTIADGCGGTLYCGGTFLPRASSGNYFTCALESDGTARCWGYNANGELGDGTTQHRYQPVVVSGLANATALVSGENHTCALINNGTVKCWGANTNGQLGDATTTGRTTPVQVSSLVNVVQITASRVQTCARLSDGTAKCWGYNGYGQLGDGTTTQRLTPVAVAGVSGIASLSMGYSQACAALSNGLVRCWGNNVNGQLGNGNTSSLTPQQVPNVAGAIEVALGSDGDFSCALLSNGTAKCWGNNTSYGMLGDGTLTDRNLPVAVSGLANAVHLQGNNIHVCAQLADGTAKCWGYNGLGAVGDGTLTSPRPTPTTVVNVSNIHTIAPGFRHTCALLNDGTAKCWGDNTYGEIGDLTTLNNANAQSVYAFPCGGGGTSNVCGACVPTTCVAQGAQTGTIADGCGGTLYCGGTFLPRASSGNYFSCMLESDGTARCWGYNANGELGDGTTQHRYQPVAVAGLANATALVSGENHTCALINNGTVRCWGYNSNGQLGDGTTTPHATAAQVPGITNAVQITASRVQTCARLSDGTAKCWGYNGYGQLGDGTTTQRLTPVAVAGVSGIASLSMGYSQACAALSNGLVKCWGNNVNGQLGNGNTSSLTPQQVPNVAGAIEVALGSDGDFSCALLSNGTAKCWGNNTSYGTLGDGTTTDRNLPVTVTGLANAVHLQGNNIHTCAQLADGTAKCWGYNGTGAVGDGTLTSPRLTPTTVVNVSNINTIAPGFRHTCALLNDGTAKCWGDNQYGELGDLTTLTNANAQSVYAFPCGGGGTSNVCSACVPTTCLAQGVQTGTIADGCGGTLYCGGAFLQRASSGNYFSCMLESDGTARCWGYNANGELGDGTNTHRYQPVVVSGLVNATSLVSGENHTCALINNGTVKCWGYNSNGQLGDATTTSRTTPVQVSGVVNAVQITASRVQTCARLSDGTAKCWGYNGYGQLGDGTTTQRLTPVAVAGVSGIASLSMGYTQACAALTNGLVRCWGNNVNGQLGNGNTSSLVPQQVPNVANAIEIACASDGDYSCALLSNGTAKCWGNNTSYGMLGDGTATDRNLPVTVTGLSNAVHMQGNNIHTCAQLADGTAKCWGYNGQGAVGDGTTTSPRLTATTVVNVSNINTIAPGFRHTCALLNDGTAKCWGDNQYGELGDLTTLNNANAQSVYAFPCGGAGTSNVCTAGCTPTTCLAQGVQTGTLADGCGGTLYCGSAFLPRASSGNYFSCMLASDGTARCWGYNANGELGDGTNANRLQPGVVSGLASATQLVSGENFSCALLQGGTVKCWGYNAHGELGDGTTTSRTTPVSVTGIATAVQLTAARLHTCARLADGTARCWGYNSSGELGDGTTTTRTSPVAVNGVSAVASLSAGYSHTCASLTNGLVKCWGNNVNGQLGNGNTSSLTPQQVPNLQGVIEVACASDGDYSCALLSNGTARCWGNNTSYGMLGDGTATDRNLPVAVSGLTNAVHLAGNNLHTCAQLADGTAKCWGYNGTAAIGDGTFVTPRLTPTTVTTASNIHTIAPGLRHTCALLNDGTAKCWGSNTYGELGDQTTLVNAGGTSPVGFPCGAAGTSNVCSPGCTPTTCATQGATSGTIADGCGGTLFCGSASQPRASSGNYASCALVSDGTVRCWGYNAYGQLGDGTTTNHYEPVTVSGLSNAIALASGENYACALVSNGTVKCWGYNANGSLGDGTTSNRSVPGLVSGISNAVSISAGRLHACARLADGTAKCWGYNVSGQLGDGTSTQRTSPVVVGGLSGIAGISTGYGHTCALLTNGLAKCWGDNTNGQLGNGNTSSLTPQYVAYLQNAVEISAASDANYSCAVLSDGTARCWGDNTSYGMLGDGTTTSRNLPAVVTGLSGAAHIAGYNLHTCAQLSNGTAKCWGFNGTGAIGDGTFTTPRLTATTVAGVSNVAAIAPGFRHTCALLNDGSAKCWGSSTYGELGNQTTIQSASAQSVYAFPCGGGGTSNVCSAGCTPTTCSAQGATSGTIADGCGGVLYCGDTYLPRAASAEYTSCMLEADGTAKCWGYNPNGTVGDGTTTNRPSPVVVSGLTGAIALVAGEIHVCALINNGTVKCWGYNAHGEIGDFSTTTRTSPVLVSGITNAVAITAGRYHTCARLSDGSARCWGYNASGQLGDGTTTNRTTPVVVSGLSGVAGISAGYGHTCAMLSTGLVRCWGDNGNGQLGNGNTASLAPVAVANLQNVIEIAAASQDDHTCALISDGTARCWGYNGNGGLGDNSTASRNLPVVVSGLSSVAHLSTAYRHSCALLTDGTAKCWGYNGTGSIGDNTTTQRLTPTVVSGLSGAYGIAAGFQHTCSLLTNGTAKCWGYNAFGQVGDNTTTQRLVPVGVVSFP